MELLKEQQETINQKKNTKKQMEKQTAFLKIFLGIAGSMILVIFLAFGFTYRNVKEIIIEEDIKTSMQAFAQVQSEVEMANETANLIATQVVLDDICSGFLNAMTDKNLNALALNRVRNQLSMYQNTNSLVESIYIYNSKVDLFVSSGNLLGTLGKYEFYDQAIVKILENPEIYKNRSLFRREMQSKYPNQTDRQETVYSYIMDVPQNMLGTVVVINMKFDRLFEKILETEMMKDSRMMIIDEDQELLMELMTIVLEGTPEFKEAVTSMLEAELSYMEYELGDEKYFVSALYSDDSARSYIKATKWDAMFASLLRVREGMLFFLGATVVVVLLIALANAVSIFRVHGRALKKYTQMGTKIKKSEMNVLQDGFLNDFIHGRKLFGKNRISQEMEKFGFAVSEGQHFTVVILQLCAYEKFLELFGKNEAYDIKYGFQNIFLETFEKEFRNLSLINRDNTITFLLETGGEENPQSRIEKCFREFLENTKVFVEWKFMLYGTARTVSLERLPELNASLKKVLNEGFFYPENTFLTYEKLLVEHNQETVMEHLGGENLSQILKMDKNVTEIYREFVSQIKGCRMTDYMNIMLWLGITISRNKKFLALSGKDEGDFLMRLSKCEKAEEVDDLFLGIFEKIRMRQSSTGSKKGVSGRLSEVKSYIEEHFKNPNMTMEQLGEEFGVSPNYLGQLFKKEMGESIAEYISNARLEWALTELAQTNRPAKDIAEECGFVNSNYFYTYFRKKVGITPQAYREKLYEKNIKAAQNIE